MKRIIFALLGALLAAAFFFAVFYLLDDRIAQCCEKPAKDEINIVMITDKNYVFPLMVSMRSALDNKNPKTKYHYFIAGVDLEEKDIKKIKSQERDNFKITVSNQKNIYKLPKYRTIEHLKPHVTKAELFKFNLCEIFQEVDKAIFLDADTLVLKDLSDYFNVDLKDFYVGAVEGPRHKRRAQIAGVGRYFNSGTMVLNFELMRKDNIAQKMVKRRLHDGLQEVSSQDAFNAIVYPKVKFLEPKYHFMMHFFYFDEYELEASFWELYHIDREKYKNPDDYLKDSYILHFTSLAQNRKPWQTPQIKMAPLWFEYAKELDNYSQEIDALDKRDLGGIS